ncbi:MAG: NADH-quinone oxidoreductase subunit J [Verrucomicrobiota bacterium]
MPDGLFTFFAALTLGAALLLVLSRNAVTSAMGMILALVGVAADFFLLDAYFLGVLQVLVYAGAVMVLFLFIIMLLDTEDPEGAYPWKTAALGMATFFLLGVGVLWLFHWSGAVPATAAGATPPELSVNPIEFTTAAKSFGRLLYTKYLLPLEIAGFLLLVALVGVVSLSKASTEENA